jgi:hypothetical protein
VISAAIAAVIAAAVAAAIAATAIAAGVARDCMPAAATEMSASSPVATATSAMATAAAPVLGECAARENHGAEERTDDNRKLVRTTLHNFTNR